MSTKVGTVADTYVQINIVKANRRDLHFRELNIKLGMSNNNSQPMLSTRFSIFMYDI